ncbi:hypothetical protein LG651_02790 [Tamlana sp. 62-3]|uniref:Uncharacterized protein n=1 Tax=Neotamlana sargassicola TaxID=2883125 RepID=A0A9X1I4J1_9FLAO|nr:hypothetical protein [Tamlana sargassicola]MCB4807163.1 hypothetical protein [Tamlana sargassicola]
MIEIMDDLAQKQACFLGVESAINELGFIGYLKTLENINSCKEQTNHVFAQKNVIRLRSICLGYINLSIHLK